MRVASEPSNETRRIARGFHVAMARVRRRLREAATDDELSPLQLAVLIDLDKGDANTAAALAAIEGVRPQSIATALEALQGRGLVVRRPDPEDGRRQLVELTDAGRNGEMAHAAVRTEWLARRIDSRLSPSERRVLADASALLERIARTADQ